MLVTLSLFAGAGAQFLDNNGNILSGGLIYTYNAGTTTPLATYTSNLGTVAQPNPIVLDSSGRIPSGELWLTTGFGYKFVTKDANNVLIGTYDNIPSSAQPPITNDASSIAYEQGNSTTAGSFIVGDTYMITSLGTTNFQTIGASANQIGLHFIATGVGSGNGTAQLSRTVQTKLQEIVSVEDFGASITASASINTAAIQAAINSLSSGIVYVNGYYSINSAIKGKSNVSIIGTGTKNGFYTETGNATYAIDMSGCVDWILENLYIDASNTSLNYPTLVIANKNSGSIVGPSARNFSVKNVYIKNSGLDSVYLDDAFNETTNGNFENCVFDGAVRNSVSVAGGQNISFNTCSFINTNGSRLGYTGGPGIGLDIEPLSDVNHLYPAKDIFVTNCYFSNNDNASVFINGAQLYGSSLPNLYHVVFSNNICNGTGRIKGDSIIQCDGSQGHIISNNIVYGFSDAALAGQTGILVSGPYLPGIDATKYVVVENNVIFDQPCGIFLGDTIENIICQGNSITLTGSTIPVNTGGISLLSYSSGGPSLNINVSNNTIRSTDSLQIGISLASPLTNSIIANNIISDCLIGIQTFTGHSLSNPLVSNNVLHSNTTNLILNDTNIILQQAFNPATTFPSTGTYLKGDIVYNSAPTAGQPQGWVCSVSGTPGTWLAMANLA